MTEKRTPEELRAAAQEAYRKREESWERSDTDGFLSQWALGLSAQKLNAQASIEEAGGRASFVGLYEGDRRLQAYIGDGRYGAFWKLHPAEARRYGRSIVPYNGTGADGELKNSSRVQKELGLTERWETAPAYAKIGGRGTGLSGQAWVEVARKDEWGDQSELIEEE